MRDFFEPKDEMIFGTRALLEALEAGKEFTKIFLQKGLKNDLSKQLLTKARKMWIPVQEVPIQKLNTLTRKNHQGAIGWISAISYYRLEQLVEGWFEQGINPLVVILDRVTDVRNLGAIARSMVAAGAHAMVVPIADSAPVNADAIKTSAGALLSLPVCREPLLQAIQYLANSGFTVVAANEKATDTLYQTDLTGPLALVLGSEDEGIHPDLLKKVHVLAKIPQLSTIASLNVSVAAGVFLFETQRQRAVHS